MSSGKKILYGAVMVLVAGLLLEAFAFGVLTFEAWRRPYKFRHEAAFYLAAMPDDWAAKFYARGYHPVLGWDGLRYGDEASKKRRAKAATLGYDGEGARVNATFSAAAPVIVAFGDSFTKGSEVAWNETWPFYLSEMLGAYVANYGVAGYGPDQATLKFRLTPVKEPKPRFAVLGIFEENINRVVNRYRPYYQEEPTGFLGFKPRFWVGPDGPQLLHSPLAEPTEDRRALAAMVEQARAGDIFWERKVEMGFPYSITLGKLGLLALGKATGKALPLEVFSGDLWGAEAASATMDAVIDAFVAEAQGREIEPVILFLPQIRRAILEDPASWVPNYGDYVEALKARYGAGGLIVLDLAEAAFTPEKMSVQPFAGHYSPYGNKVVARYLYDQLGLAGQPP